MGMDVYGLNPKENTKMTDYPTLNKYNKMDHAKKWEVLDKSKKERDKYWAEKDKFNKDNPGVYFRNNCWWWRPLWNYCYFISRHYNLNLISEELFESGHSNDGAGLDAEGAMTLAMHLQMSIEDGTAENYDSEYKQEMEASDDEFAKSYPFDIRNVSDFAEFLEYSGGFSIC